MYIEEKSQAQSLKTNPKNLKSNNRLGPHSYVRAETNTAHS